ncbi:carboxypeptidase regulatory-like domain-containing protein [bacterium]|nr:carboxypeptidase regulatory-like domain-containing protein [bacterium]
MNIRSVLMGVSLAGLLAAGIGCGGGASEDEDMMRTAAPAAAKKAIDAATAGSVSGKIMFSGTAPKMGKIDMAAEATCAAKHAAAIRDESVLVNDNGTLRNVVVRVKSGLEEYAYPAMSGEPMLDQSGCVYEPHVLIMTPGNLKIKSSDNVLHNVHSESKINKSFNRAQPTPSTIEASLTKPEMVSFKCDVHPWMRAYAVVVENGAAAVTGTDGAFNIGSLPPGTYVIEAWHEKYGSKEMTVTVESGKAAEANFTFSPAGA